MAGSAYTEWAPSEHLAGHVACLWRGRIADSGVPYTDRIIPDGCVDLIFGGERLFVAGPDTRAVLLDTAPAQTFVGIRMRPGHAPILLGRPASEVLDQRADLGELWPRHDAAVLTETVLAARSPAAVAAAFETAIVRRLACAPRVDVIVDALSVAMSRPAARGRGLVERLAAELGVTERTLHRRCVEAVGYGPKMLDRVLRFQRVRALARTEPTVSLARLALDVGYCDQSHFTRECRRLSGLAPSELFKTSRRPRDAFGAWPT